MNREFMSLLPHRDLTRFREEMHDLFGRMLVPSSLRTLETDLFPAADLSETKEGYHLRLELPGVDAKDLQVHCEDATLTVRGEKRSDREEKERTHHRIERSFGSFFRSFDLPGPIEPGKVGATFRNGVLEVDLPKSAAQKSRRVEVKIA